MFNPMLQPSDSVGRFWEELSTHPECDVNPPNDRTHEPANSSVTHLIKSEVEETKSSQMPAMWIPSSIGRHDDIDMEPSNDLQRAKGSLRIGTMINLPERISRTSELPKDSGAFAEELELLPDHSLLMDIEPSESAGLSSSPPVAPLPQPLLAQSHGDIVMLDETIIRKSKDIQILERVGETLRQKKLRATQA
ncbi:uncharacterized protein LOC133378435 isoform X2 [Rhineura floridana]|uniref:uncharacterized protein LOC133378435 isoform X2 n=1 Tax=Rhineura floridana TaxID=261503 RepID=UPI002AC87F9F|nr:uncharacterized protein LOC133378435 isoform X2 [Rhineura floridana]